MTKQSKNHFVVKKFALTPNLKHANSFELPILFIYLFSTFRIKLQYFASSNQLIKQLF